uniref:Nonstructural protein n=1 Tax=Panagrellus redivivus TaxID=6233 RepID=A0A7E4VBD3_PANRE
MTFYFRKVFTRKPNDSTTQAPDVRIVERSIYWNSNTHHDAPPTYLTAMYSELPTYETVANPVEPPEYTE